MATKTKQLTVTKRIVDSKRHTVGYVINDSHVGRDEAVLLATRNWIKGVKIKKTGNNSYLMGDGEHSLYSLPILVKTTGLS